MRFAQKLSAIKGYNSKTKFSVYLQTQNFSHITSKTVPDTLLSERRNSSIVMTLNNPKQMNALNSDMMAMLANNLKEFERNSSSIDMVFFRGVGKALSAGGDIKVFLEGTKNPKKSGPLHEYLDDAYKALYRFQTSKIPNISIMNGWTVGVGAGFCFCTKVRIATEQTLLMMPETRIGHFCDVSSSYHLSRLDGFYGRYLGLCAERSKAEDLLYSGIATHFVPSDRLDDMIQHLTDLESSNLKVIHQEINKFTETLPRTDRLTTTKDISQQEKHQLVKHCFQFNTVEQILDALDKEGSKFSLATKEKILLGSPVAAKVTLELLTRAPYLTFEECLLLERKLWSLDIGAHDFTEGCMSMLDKRQPKWHNSHLSELDLDVDIRSEYFGKTKSLSAMDFMA